MITLTYSALVNQIKNTVVSLSLVILQHRKCSHTAHSAIPLLKSFNLSGLSKANTQ